MKWLHTSAALGASLALTLGLPSAAHAGMTASAVRETQKIRPTDPAPPAASSIALSCAQNEFCAFQIAVTASGSAVTVSDISASDWGDPGGDTIAGSSALIYREGFLDVTTPSNSEGMTG